ncbi:hypothetical protein SASPL_101705 [Salvia splendens]|uniref:Myb/SANT-like domain-containing protein n=1 Tax=Salvia splendens TaxID=180675 RepID=A0A8X8YW83_SALSN|nr:hypothetical protein SASPL_101705 [Salvia splendens]
MELDDTGWKSDNGYRCGYMARIEDNLQKEFLTTDLRGTPHIVSRMGAWKKNYNSLRKILSRTGVGFSSDGAHKIDCSDEQWEQIVARSVCLHFHLLNHVLQADRDAKFMRNKSWPLWEQWTVIFGKDRASGGTDGAREVHMHNVAHNDDPSNDYHVSLEDLFDEPIIPPVTTTNTQQDESTGQSQQPVPTQRETVKKCKAASSDAALLEFLANLHDVFEKLRCVAGLTMVQRYELCNILADKPQRLEVFMGMAAEPKPGYVLWLLGQEP